MHMLLIQPGSAGQTLALVCFGIAILALMWLYRRDRARLFQRQRGGGLPRSITEMQDRVDRAQQHIGLVEEKERERRLSDSIHIGRQQDALSVDQQTLLTELTHLQDGTKPVKEAG